MLKNENTQGVSVSGENRQMIVWLGALAAGAVLGLLGIEWLNDVMGFVATVYTRLFQLLAVPTIAFALTTTMARFGEQKETGRILRHTVTYTLLTTFTAALLGMVLYIAVSPGNMTHALIEKGMADVPDSVGTGSYMDYFMSVIPNNIIRPLLDGNVLAVLLLSFAVGIALAKMPQSERKRQ